MHLPRHERTPAGPHPLLIPCVNSGSSALAVDTSGMTAVFERCTHHKAQHAPSKSWRCLRSSTCPCQVLPGTRGPPAQPPAPAEEVRCVPSGLEIRFLLGFSTAPTGSKKFMLQHHMLSRNASEQNMWTPGF